MKKVVVLRRTGGDVPMQEGRDVWWHEVATDETACPCEPMDSEDLLYLLYTSGTTARPKGIVHTTGGYLVGVAATHRAIFDIKPETDVYWCAADVGWVTGHSYIVYGPLCNGTTGIMYEGTPDFPDKDRWWAIVERYGVTILYTAPTAIRAHMKWGAEYAAEARPLLAAPARHGRRADQPGGVDLVPRAHRRRRDAVVDTWWQTETGMALITPLPGGDDRQAGLGDAAVPGHRRGRATTSRETRSGPAAAAISSCVGRGRRCCAASTGTTTGMSATYWSRFPGVYFAGDGARIDRDGDFWLLGRVDDVMNISGHRISTIEVESALVDHHAVAEAAVCGRTDALTGQAIVAYVTLRGGREGSVEMLEELRDHVAKVIGPIAKPANIVFTPELPKTRSGKIMRRLLRDVAEHRPLGRHDDARRPGGRRGDQDASGLRADRGVSEERRRSSSARVEPEATVGPRPLLDARAQAGLDRIQQDVGAGLEDTLLAVDDPRGETLCEDVPEAPVAPIERAGVPRVQPLQRVREPGLGRLDDEVVVGRQDACARRSTGRNALLALERERKQGRAILAVGNGGIPATPRA